CRRIKGESPRKACATERRIHPNKLQCTQLEFEVRPERQKQPAHGSKQIRYRATVKRNISLSICEYILFQPGESQYKTIRQLQCRSEMGLLHESRRAVDADRIL